MAVGVQQAAERIFHRAGRRGVNVAFHGRQMHDIFPDKIIRNANLMVGENPIQRQHFPFRLIHIPGHVFRLEVIQHRDVILLENRHVEV